MTIIKSFYNVIDTPIDILLLRQIAFALPPVLNALIFPTKSQASSGFEVEKFIAMKITLWHQFNEQWNIWHVMSMLHAYALRNNVKVYYCQILNFFIWIVIPR